MAGGEGLIKSEGGAGAGGGLGHRGLGPDVPVVSEHGVGEGEPGVGFGERGVQLQRAAVAGDRRAEVMPAAIEEAPSLQEPAVRLDVERGRTHDAVARFPGP